MMKEKAGKRHIHFVLDSNNPDEKEITEILDKRGSYLSIKAYICMLIKANGEAPYQIPPAKPIQRPATAMAEDTPLSTHTSIDDVTAEFAEVDRMNVALDIPDDCLPDILAFND